MQKEILSRLDEIQASIRDLRQASERPMSLDEAATYLHVSKSHTYQLTSKGLIAHFKPAGKKIFFRKSDLDAYLLRNRRASESELEQAAVDHIVRSGASDKRNGRQRRSPGTYTNRNVAPLAHGAERLNRRHQSSADSYRTKAD